MHCRLMLNIDPVPQSTILILLILSQIRQIFFLMKILSSSLAANFQLWTNKQVPSLNEWSQLRIARLEHNCTAVIINKHFRPLLMHADPFVIASFRIAAGDEKYSIDVSREKARWILSSTTASVAAAIRKWKSNGWKIAPSRWSRSVPAQSGSSRVTI